MNANTETTTDAEPTESFQSHVYIVGVTDRDSDKWNRDAVIAHSEENAKHQARHQSMYSDPKVYHCRMVAEDIDGASESSTEEDDER